MAGGIGIPVAMAATASVQDYRTAVVGRGTVTQTLRLAGSVQRVNQVTASFAAQAAVTAVDVTVGQTVTAGQKLATEDPTALRAALLSAQATLAAQQAALAADQSTSAPSSSTDASAAAFTTNTAGGSAAATPPSTLDAPVTGASRATGSSASSPSASHGGTGAWQSSTAARTLASGAGGTNKAEPTPSTAEVRAHLATAQRALAAVRTELAGAQKLCTPLIDAASAPSQPPAARTTHPGSGSTPGSTQTPAPGPTPTVTAGPTPTPTHTPTPTPTPSATPAPHPSPASAPPTTSGGSEPEAPTATQVAACEAALTTTTDALQAVTRSISSIVSELESAASAPAHTSATQAPPTGSHTPVATDGTRRQTAASGAGSGRTNTHAGDPSAGGAQSQASRVASDQVSLLQAQQAVTQAQTDLDDATLVAPISGRVGAITLTVGQTATATAGVVIVGSGAATVTVQVPLSAMPSMHAGQSAQVTPAGAATAVAGTVQTVSLLPSSGGGTTPTYPATVVVAAPTAAMPTGAQASVAVTVGGAADALRVPASALSGRTGRSASVAVLDGRSVSRTPIAIGVVGDGWVQVLSGLTAGQTVVLADASEPLPANTTGLSGFGRGGFGGGIGQRAGRAE